MQLLDQEARHRSSLEATFSADIAQWDAHDGRDDDEEATAMAGYILSGSSDDEAAHACSAAAAGGVSTPDSLSREEMPRLAPVATPKRQTSSKGRCPSSGSSIEKLKSVLGRLERKDSVVPRSWGRGTAAGRVEDEDDQSSSDLSF